MQVALPSRIAEGILIPHHHILQGVTVSCQSYLVPSDPFLLGITEHNAPQYFLRFPPFSRFIYLYYLNFFNTL